MVIEVPPSVLTEVISVTPEIWASRRSSGAASEEATVAGSAPGSEAETETIGKSTRGIAATGQEPVGDDAQQKQSGRQQRGPRRVAG